MDLLKKLLSNKTNVGRITVLSEDNVENTTTDDSEEEVENWEIEQCIPNQNDIIEGLFIRIILILK